ncbi:MAG: histidine phosphatase family protein [Candidatus Roizmanbacteria bacterium]
MTIIYLIRHGESILNTKAIVQGDHDDPTNHLSARGREQAAAVANKLSAISVACIYTSPLTRAHETAGAIAAKHPLKMDVYHDLHEKNQGSMRGMQIGAALAKYGDWENMTEDERLDTRAVPNEESQRDLYHRALRVVKDLSQKHAEQTIFCITHGGFMRALYTQLAHKSLKEKWRFDNCGFMKIKVDGDHITILETDKLHLELRG